MKLVYPAVLTPRAQGKYGVRFPDLPGCVTSGQGLSEAMDMAVDAASVWLCAAEDHREPLPAPSNPASLTLAEGELTTLIQVDTLAYRRLTDTRAVRKNVSIPAWMATLAEQRGVNCSQVLQDALRALFAQG